MEYAAGKIRHIHFGPGKTCRSAPLAGLADRLGGLRSGRSRPECDMQSADRALRGAFPSSSRRSPDRSRWAAPGNPSTPPPGNGPRRSAGRASARGRPDQAVERSSRHFHEGRFHGDDVAESLGEPVSADRRLRTRAGCPSLVAAPDPLDRPARRKETATAQLALAAALRGDQGYDGLLAGLDRVTAGEPAGILGVLCRTPARWAQGCHAALAGQPAVALHHFEQMTQPTADPAGRLRPAGRRDPTRSPRPRRGAADRAGGVRRAGHDVRGRSAGGVRCDQRICRATNTCTPI